MAEVRVTPQLVAELVFPNALVQIRNSRCETSPTGSLDMILDIEGPDVPDVDRVFATITVEVERRSVEFREVP